MRAPSDAAAVRDTNRAFYEAFEALDLEAMQAVWSVDETVSCIHPGWEPVEGRAAVMESWANIFRGTEAIQFTLRDIKVFVSATTAWVVLIEEIQARHRDRTLVASAQATNVFVREVSGWRLVHHHSGPLFTGGKKPEGTEGLGRDADGGGTRLLH